VPIAVFNASLRKIVNVPLPFIMAESIVKAAQTFCRKSQLIIYTRSLGDVTALQDYTLISDSELNTNKSLLKCSEVISISGQEPGSPEPITLHRGSDYVVYSRDEISFNLAYTNVQVRCAVEPVQSATELPIVLLEDYLDGICSGAASLLFMQPDSDWSSARLAKHHDTLFIESIVEARRFRLDANPHQTTASRPVVKRNFY